MSMTRSERMEAEGEAREDYERQCRSEFRDTTEEDNMRDNNKDQVDQTEAQLDAELRHPMDHARECCDGKNQYNGHKLFIVVQRDEPTCEDCDCETPVHHVDVTPTNLAKAAPALLSACEEAKALIEQLHATWLNPKERSKTMDAVDVFWMHWLRPAIDAAKGER